MNELEKSWWKATAYTVCFWIAGFAVSPFINGLDYAQFGRLFFNKLLVTSLFTVVASRCIVSIDQITPGNWLEKVYESSSGCAIVIAAIVFMVGLVFIFA